MSGPADDPLIPVVVIETIKREVGALVLQTMLQIEQKTSDPELRWTALRDAVKVLVRKDGGR